MSKKNNKHRSRPRKEAGAAPENKGTERKGPSGEQRQTAASNRQKTPPRRPRRSENQRDQRTSTYKKAPEYVYTVKNQKTSETYICGFDSKIDAGTYVVAPTRYGPDMAIVLGYVRSMMLEQTVADLGPEQPFLDEQSSECGNCSGCQGCEESPVPAEGPVDAPELETPEPGVEETAQSEGEKPEAAQPEGEEPEGEEPEGEESEAQEPEATEQQIEKERAELFEKARTEAREARDAKLKDLDRIIRVADDYDIATYEQNVEKAREAVAVCKEKIAHHNLDMKLVDAHYLLSEQKVLFFFTAETRVDFRELVKDLVSVFRMRIELRQIGVRDESRVLGGMGVCGRDYCCHGVSDRLRPVSIKMAKEQNLSLNSMKISGPCGRLLCCLAYEYDFYREEKAHLPSAGSRLKIRGELLKISEVNILSKRYYLTASDGRMLMIPFEKVLYNQETGRWDVDKKYIEEVLSV